jgi:membrane fusion protein, multidrug efflux system
MADPGCGGAPVCGAACRRGFQAMAMRRLWLVGPLLVAALAACGERSAPQASARAAPEVGVVAVKAQPVTLASELPGRTAAYRIAQVRPQVSGILEQRLYTEGQEVTAGAPLYRIDPRPYEAAVAQARAALARAQAAHEVARLRAERYAPLAASGAVPKQDNDDVQAGLRQAQAEVAAARAALEAAQINLDYTRIGAPIAGVTSESFVTEGALVTAGQAQHLAVVTQLDPIYVDIPRTTAELARLRRNLAAGGLERLDPEAARVTLLLDDGSEYPHPGQLQVSGVTVDPGTDSVNLRAVFPNPERQLLPGMYVHARLEEGVDPAALAVPQQAVSRDAEGRASVLVVKGDDTLERRPITTGRALGATWLVEGGLAPGDRVVVRGPLRLQPGMPVKPVPADVPATAAGSPGHG